MLNCKFPSNSSTIASTSNSLCPKKKTPFKIFRQKISIPLLGKNLGLVSVRPIRRGSLKMAVNAVSSVETR